MLRLNFLVQAAFRSGTNLPDHILDAVATAVDKNLVIDATRKDVLSKKVSHLLNAK
jgi:hypothetical protein